MIVVDSSVLIDFFEGRTTVQVDQFKRRLARGEPMLLGDLVLHEVLRGARDGGSEMRIRQGLASLRLVEMVGEQVAFRAALHYRLLRSHGVTLATVDLLIGTFCVANRHRLLHSDRDFAPMVQHLGLMEA